MRTFPALAPVLASLWLVAVPVLAQNSVSTQHEAEPVTLHGKVAKIEWMNPRARLQLEVEDSSGKPKMWDVELGSANGLMRKNGWNKAPFRVGDEITIEANPAKNGDTKVRARNFTLENGTKVFVESSEQQKDPCTVNPNLPVCK
jgi:hypothetical protein